MTRKHGGSSASSADRWANIHRHLGLAPETISNGDALNEDQERQILKKRAQALATEVVSVIEHHNETSVVEFLLGKEHYAIAHKFIREVLPIRDITPLPGTPDFILGIVNVRGEIFSVMDVKRIFGVEGADSPGEQKLILLHNPNMALCILVDGIVGARNLPVDHKSSSLPALGKAGEKYFERVTEDRLIILNGEKILSDPEIIVNE